MSRKHYYHGGPSGITGWIEPPEVTGAKCAADYGDEDFRKRVVAVHRRDRVYVTTNAVAAMLWGAGFPDGTVYRVEPEGAIEDDPDCSQPGLSFQCSRARIVGSRRMTDSDRRTMLLAIFSRELA